MSDLLEIVNTHLRFPLLAAEESPFPAASELLMWAAYSAGVFYVGRMTSHVSLSSLLRLSGIDSGNEAGRRDASVMDESCDELLAEIRQEIDAHNRSTSRLNDELETNDESRIREVAAETKSENDNFQDYLRERCSELEKRPQKRGDAVSEFLRNLTRHRRRAGEFGKALRKFEQTSDLESALSPLRAQIEDLMQHNRRLQGELDRTRETIAKQNRQLEEAEEAARVDALTELPNRRAFDEQIQKAHARFLKNGTPYVVALLDVDRFKKFNDVHGHAVGDEVLRIVAGTLGNARRDTDHVARYGGEEFVVLLPRLTGHQAKFVIDRHRDHVEKQPLHVGGKRLSITVSAGVAEVTSGETVQAVLERADQALYAAKEAGRNQTCLEENGTVVYFSGEPAPEYAPVG